MKYGLVAFNIFAATVCAVATVMNFSAGNAVAGSIMSGLCVMNILIAILNVNRH